MEDTMIFKVESQLHAYCFQWFHNTFPPLRRMLHHNDNNSYNSIEGARKKSMGVIRGVSDFEFICFCGILFLEAKLPGETQSDEQIDFMNKVRERGHTYILFYTFEEFKNIILKHINHE